MDEINLMKKLDVIITVNLPKKIVKMLHSIEKELKCYFALTEYFIMKNLKNYENLYYSSDIWLNDKKFVVFLECNENQLIFTQLINFHYH